MQQATKYVLSILLFCAFLTALIDFSHFHRLTPLFWGQNDDRMLGPALFTPVHDIFTNFLFHNAAMIFCGVAVNFAAALFMFRRRAAFLVGAINLAAILVWGAPEYCYDQLGPSLLFTTPLLLGIAALYLLETPARWLRRSVAVALMVLACWINVSAPLPLLIIAVTPHTFWRPLRQGGWRRWLRSAAAQQLRALGLGAVVGGALLQLVPYRGPSVDLLPIAQWARAIGSTARKGISDMGGVAGWPVLPLFILACLMLGSALYFATCLGAEMPLYLRSPRHRTTRMRLWGPCSRAVGLAAMAACFVCIHPGVANDGFVIRSGYPEMLVAQLACIAWALLPWLERQTRPRHRAQRRIAYAAAAIILVACVVGRFGAPALDNPPPAPAPASAQTLTR